MKIFHCDCCGQPVYFDNDQCGACGSVLGFLPSELRFVALEWGDGGWRSRSQPGVVMNFCENHTHDACNWLVETPSTESFCPSCRLNHMIPPLDTAANVDAWRALEGAKRRLIYSLLRLGLPLESKTDAPETGLAFDFLSENAQTGNDGPVLTGHANGLITLNIAEADPVYRERARKSMGEPYRTIIGHFRHEIGHYYWERLVQTDAWTLERFRALFGDERFDYAEALKIHYESGPKANWPEHFLSAYASAHPWEDWAETWAHYLHLMDVLETAHAFGMRLEPNTPNTDALSLRATFDPYEEMDIDNILAAALPLTLAVNSLNRGMGQPDIYPFVLKAPVGDKLRFVHELIRNFSNR